MRLGILAWPGRAPTTPSISRGARLSDEATKIGAQAVGGSADVFAAGGPGGVLLAAASGGQSAATRRNLSTTSAGGQNLGAGIRGSRFLAVARRPRPNQMQQCLMFGTVGAAGQQFPDLEIGCQPCGGGAGLVPHSELASRTRNHWSLWELA